MKSLIHFLKCSLSLYNPYSKIGPHHPYREPYIHLSLSVSLPTKLMIISGSVFLLLLRLQMISTLKWKGENKENELQTKSMQKSSRVSVTETNCHHYQQQQQHR